MEVIETLFKTYGFASATVIGLISYFGTRFFSTVDKKNELKYGLFQQVKIQAINSFIDVYSDSNLLWHQIPFDEIIQNKMSGKQIDDLVLPIHNRLHAMHYKLQVVLTEDEMKEFTEIYNSFNAIQNHLRKLAYIEPRGNLIEKGNDYGIFLSIVGDLNKDRLKNIGEKFRKTYL